MLVSIEDGDLFVCQQYETWNTVSVTIDNRQTIQLICARNIFTRPVNLSD